MKPILILLLLTAALPAQPPDRAQAALKAAIDKEVADGDLKSAIALYTRVADTYKTNKPVAAQALLRLGQCHEKLGQTAAAGAYNRLLAQYADQKEAATARARLAAITATGPQATLVWDNSTEDNASVSADGRFISFIHWPTSGLGIRDLATSTDRVIPNISVLGRGKGEPGANVISPDGRRVAFAHYTQGGPSGYRALSVVNVDGSGLKQIATAGEHIEPFSWLPAATHVLASLVTGQQSRLALVPAAGGPPQFLDVPAHPRFSAAYPSPDGRWFAYSASETRGGPVSLYLAGNAAETKLADDANLMGWAPSGDAVLFSRSRAGKFILYSLPIRAGRPAGAPRQIQTTADVGRTPMGVTADGRLFFATGNRQSDVLVFPWSGDPARIGEPLHTFPVSDYIPYHLSGAGVRFSPDGRRVLSPGLANDLIVRDLASGATRSIASPLKAMSRLDWAPSGDAVLILGTDPAGRFGLHRYDLAGNSLTQLAALPEATTRDFLLSPDGQTLYHGDHTAIYARRLPAGEDRKLWGEASMAGQMQLHLARDGKTLIVRLSGFLGALDLTTNRMRELYRTGESNRNTLWASALTPDGSAVMTIRRLPGMKMEFATFPLDGGQPKVIVAPSTWRGLALSPDGKWLATARLTRRDQIWSLANFLPR